MIFRILESRRAWDELHSRAPLSSIYSQWSWQEVLRFSGWRVRPVGVEVEGRLEAAAFLCRKRAPLVGWTVYDVHRSIVGTNAAALRRLLAGCLDLVRRERGARLTMSTAAWKRPTPSTRTTISPSPDPLRSGTPNRSNSAR